MARRYAAFALATAAFVHLSGTAEARTTKDSPYTYEQTFGSALRLLTVDLGFKVTERDAEWGYVLFEYEDPSVGNRKPRGSFEFVKLSEGVRVIIQLPSLPSYHEQLLLDKLDRKLGEDHGGPPKHERPKKEPSDKGKDGDKGDGDKGDGDKGDGDKGDGDKDGDKDGGSRKDG